MPFSLVRLLHADTNASPLQQGITNADGRFRFTGVPPGDYHLQILRIGFRPALSPAVHLRRGDALHYEFRSEPLPVHLPAILVHGTADCLGSTDLASDSTLATLWSEARRGVDTRRAFELRYRFKRSLRQAAQVRWRLRPDRHQEWVDTLASEPDSVAIREARTRVEHAADGYGKGNRLIVPDEKEVLGEDFLNEHCIETTVVLRDGAFGIRFRPASIRPHVYAIRGTIWLDSATFLARQIEYEHLDGAERFSEVVIDYAPVRVGGSVIRLPSSGRVTLRPRGPGHWMASAVTATLNFGYWDFQDASPATSHSPP